MKSVENTHAVCHEVLSADGPLIYSRQGTHTRKGRPDAQFGQK